MSTTPALSVVVPTRDRIEALLTALDHLAAQTLEPSAFEVLVCDDGSTDGTQAELARRRWPFALTHLRQGPRGFAAARNLGIEEARAPVTLFLAEDTFLAPEALAEHVSAHEDFGDVRLMVLGDLRFAEPFRSTRLGHLLEHTPHLFPYCLLEPGDTADHNFATTAHLSIATDTARSFPFDERFTLSDAEDLDFALNLVRRGWSVYYDADARAALGRTFTVREFGRLARRRGHSRAVYLDKRGITNDGIDALIATLDARDTTTEQLDAAVAYLEPRVENVPWRADRPLDEDAYRALTMVYLSNLRLGMLDFAPMRAHVGLAKELDERGLRIKVGSTR